MILKTEAHLCGTRAHFPLKSRSLPLTLPHQIIRAYLPKWETGLRGRVQREAAAARVGGDERNRGHGHASAGPLTGQASASPSNFHLILDAFDQYASQVGIDLTENPLADVIRRCDSPNAVLQLLQDKAQAFKDYRDGDRTLINWLKPVVQVVHGFSGVLGEAISLVPFPPASAVFVGVDVLLTAASNVSSSYDSLVDLFECLANFLKRLQIYTSIPFTPLMTDIIVKILAELLSVLALATKQVQQGRLKKFAKKLLGECEIEAVLQKLDRLTQEEARVMAAQTLEVVHCLVNNVKVVMDDGRASLDGVKNVLGMLWP
ncbi:hypothetical protein EDB87DRAFT_1820685, partial [Lactarius vividus]